MWPACANSKHETLIAANKGAEFSALQAPEFSDIWRDSRQIILSALSSDLLPADGVVLIGDTTLEREWSLAGRLAGYLPAERYFPPTI